MSFAGHVFDMIRRSKENRNLLNARRERTKEMKEKRMNSGLSQTLPDVTLEELETYKRESLKKKDADSRYILKMGLLFLLIAVMILLFIWFLFTFNP